MVVQLMHLDYAAALIGMLIISFNIYATLSLSRKYLMLIAAVEIVLITGLYSSNMNRYESDVTDFATRVGLSRNDQFIKDAYSKLTETCRSNIKGQDDLSAHLRTADDYIEKRQQDKKNKQLYV